MMQTGVFELVNTTDPSQTIPFRLIYDDFFKPSTSQLAPSAWDGGKRGVVSCAPVQLNAGLTVEIDAVDLAVVTAGTYQASFTMLAQRTGFDLDQETVNIQISIGETAWIQRLDPIALGYTAGSDASGNEPFCVWTTTGAYDVTISSQTPTASTTFVAAGQAAPVNTVNFGVQFDTDADASDGVAVTEGTTILNQSPSASGSPPSCVVDNSAIYVNFPEAGNLARAPGDTYADELTLLIEPR
jgi:hypothetical protein